MEAHFEGSSDKVSYFIVATEEFLRRWGYQFHSEAEAIIYTLDCFDSTTTDWYIDLDHLRAPELCSLELFFQLFCAQFGDPALVENTRTDLRKLKQGNTSVKEYSATFRTIPMRFPDWPEGLLVDY